MANKFQDNKLKFNILKVEMIEEISMIEVEEEVIMIEKEDIIDLITIKIDQRETLVIDLEDVSTVENKAT
jgi:hypothetical protein